MYQTALSNKRSSLPNVAYGYSKYLFFPSFSKYLIKSLIAAGKLNVISGIFNASSYGVVTKDILDKPDIMPSVDLKLKTLRLQQLIMQRQR